MRGYLAFAAFIAVGCAGGEEGMPIGPPAPVLSSGSDASASEPWVPDGEEDSGGEPGTDTDWVPPQTSGPDDPSAATTMPMTSAGESGTGGFTTAGDDGFGDSSTGFFGTGDGGGGGGQLGDDCQLNTDCTSNVCVDDGIAPFCSVLCNSILDCPLLWECIETDTAGVKVCY